MRYLSFVLVLGALGVTSAAQVPTTLSREVDAAVEKAMPDIVRWRRDFHQHPELGNREFRTSKVIAGHLERLGLDVRTGVAHTGVVGILRGGQPGPVVALRADMDGLPVTEQNDLPFRSTAKATWDGQEVGVMHACGHDMHMAILLGVAEVLAPRRDRLAGTVVFMFQPAEEGPPEGEEGGAALMIKEGVLDNPKVHAVFGLHVFPLPVGTIQYRSGPLMASADSFTIKVIGRQTHGAVPWAGVDPIVIGAQIVTSLQTIISRSVNITSAPAVVTIGAFNGGNRFNIVPDEVVMQGTVRAFDEQVRADIHRRIRAIAGSTAEAGGGRAEVTFGLGYPSTVNDPALTARMVPTLARVAGDANVTVGPLTGTAEDFSYFQQKVPGMYFFLGVAPRNQDPKTVAANHSPLFFADEAALPVGVRSMVHLALDYLAGR